MNEKRLEVPGGHLDTQARESSRVGECWNTKLAYVDYIFGRSNNLHINVLTLVPLSSFKKLFLTFGLFQMTSWDIVLCSELFVVLHVGEVGQF